MTKLVDAIEQLKAAKNAMMVANDATVVAKTALDHSQTECHKQAYTNLSSTPLYKAFLQLRDTTNDLAKSLNANYCDWYRCGPDGDDVDFTVPYPETEEPLSPFVQQLRTMNSDAQIKLAQLLNTEEARIYNDVVADSQKAYDSAVKAAADAKERYKRAIEQLKWGCPELIVTGTQIDAIENIIKDNVDKSYCQDDEFSASPDAVSIDGSFEISRSTELDDDELYEDASDIPDLELEPIADKICDRIVDVLSEAYPGYSFDITYDIDDQEYTGDTEYHRGYYEDDTGYGEPAGDFYVGTVTNSATLGVCITITKEEQ